MVVVHEATPYRCKVHKFLSLSFNSFSTAVQPSRTAKVLLSKTPRLPSFPRRLNLSAGQLQYICTLYSLIHCTLQIHKHIGILKLRHEYKPRLRLASGHSSDRPFHANSVLLNQPKTFAHNFASNNTLQFSTCHFTSSLFHSKIINSKTQTSWVVI